MAGRIQAGVGSARSWRVEPLRSEQARDILGWRYPAPYDFYNPPAGADDEILVREFLRPELGFHAVLEASAGFVGFCSFGRDGQVPGGDYRTPALDIGLGMKPELTGRGLGRPFFAAILCFARSHLSPERFRLTVADFNERALALYHKFGFEAVDGFTEGRSGVDYTILVRVS